MHFVTSAIFLPVLLLPGKVDPLLTPSLSIRSRLLLLRGYLATCAGWFVASGQPPLPIKDFYSATSQYLTAPRAAHARVPEQRIKRDLDDPGLTMPVGTSAWARIWANVVVHPNEHLIKLIRALGYFAVAYAGVEKGHFAGVENKDTMEAEVDGTLFVRVAGLTMDRLGWAYEKDPTGLWD